MSKFDADTLRALRDTEEVTIRTDKHPETGVVVAAGEVFRRSAGGARGRWSRALAAGGSAALEVAGRRLAVQAMSATDQASIARASREYLRKYQSSPYAQTVVRAEVLPTTL